MAMMWLSETAVTASTEAEIDALSPDLVNSDRLSRLYRFWKEIRGSRRLPCRSDFAPEQLGFILGQMAIVDVLRDPANFRYRLIGTRLEEAGRRGDQGKTLDQIEPAAYRRMVEQTFRVVVETGQPLCHQISYVHHQSLVSFEQIILPFSRAGDTVEVLLEALDWLPGVQHDFKSIARAQVPAVAPPAG
jgi:hypothetical protein